MIPEVRGRGYKLLEMDVRTGSLYPLFIGKDRITAVGVWLPAEDIPTRGFSHRPGWHVNVSYPFAPQLLDRSGRYASRRGNHFKRVWCEVSYAMDIDYSAELRRTGARDLGNRIPENGCYPYSGPNGTWMISGAMCIDRILQDNEVRSILEDGCIDYDRIAREFVERRFKVKLPEDWRLYP